MEDPNDVVIVTNVYGDICIRKARRKRQKILVKELMYDYANNTTLHGLPYVTRTGLTLIEKIFWLVTFVLSVILCLFLISKVWHKWQTSPVIVTVSEQLVPVHEVPFPSVTICPQSKCKVSIYNYTREKVTVDDFMMTHYNATINETMLERIAELADISQVCDLPLLFRLSEISNYHTDASIVNNILKVALNYSDVFEFCLVHAQGRSCRTLFDKVLTSEGLCYNMNSLAASEIFRPKTLQEEYKYLYTTKPTKGWSLKQGYTDPLSSYEAEAGKKNNVYPAPGAENGKSPDIEIILKHTQTERDPLCNGLNSGFKVYIQHPTDLPQSSLYYYAVLDTQVSSMALSFSVLNTSESLKSYDAEVRQCYFTDERYLKYFKLYTASNCRIECLSNITYEQCGCVAFHMPHNSSSKICTQVEESCMSRARRKMRRQELDKSSFRCHCLPACNSMDYDAEILKTNFNLKQLLQTHQEASNFSYNLSDGFEIVMALVYYRVTTCKSVSEKELRIIMIELHLRVNYSKLELYFKRPRFLSMRRSELFGLIDFLANCGGLLGLFLGFSFLSLIEIIYFLSLRLCCTLKKDLEEEKAQHEEGKEININKY